MTTADLPALNATLNGVSAMLLTSGWVFVRRGEVAKHKACMVGALVTSSAFLASYVVYHALHGSTPFWGTGAIRTVYFAILVPHVVLAAILLPLALTTVYRAITGNFERHRKIARITFPIWEYVSITGVVIYWMLYELGPS